MLHDNYIQAISSQLDGQLPGWEAQKAMSPIPEAPYRIKNKDAKQAAVMVLLHPNINDELSLFYIKRTSDNPNDKHRGQISFPGGQKDAVDNDFIDTSLRETHEEIGVDPKDIHILGELSSIFVFASNFFVQPIVGYLPYNPKLRLQASEVQYTIQTPVNQLLSPEAILKKDFKMGQFNAKNMPYYNLKGEVLWGATAMITSEFLAVLNTLK